MSDVLKTTVENRHREKLGTIHDLMVGVDGRIKYAILSHGGFLGIGDVLIPIPFDALMTGGENGFLSIYTLLGVKLCSDDMTLHHGLVKGVRSGTRTIKFSDAFEKGVGAWDQ